MRLVLAMLLQHEQNNLKTDVEPFTIHPCSKLSWNKSGVVAGCDWKIVAKVEIFSIFCNKICTCCTFYRPGGCEFKPGQTTNHSLYTNWWDYASCDKKPFLSSDDSSFGGDTMVVAHCLERAHVGLSGLCCYRCGWARWHKTCIQEAV